MDNASFLAHIGERFVDAALSQHLWPDVLAEVSRHLGAVGCDLHLLRRGQVASNYMGEQPPEVLAEYTERFIGREPRSIALSRARPGAVLTDLMFTDRDFMRKDAYYADFLLRAGMGHCIAVLPFARSEAKAYFGVHLPRASGPPEREQLQFVQSMQPSLSKALHLMLRMDELTLENHLSSAALDCLSTALVIVDSRGKILLANKAATTLIADRRVFVVHNGRLSATGSADAAALHTLTAAASRRVDGSGGGLLLQGDGVQYSVMVSPVPSNMPAIFQPAALLTISDLTTRHCVETKRHLQNLFMLTESEAYVAQAMLDGLTLAEAADAKGVTYRTARTLLQRAFTKVGVNQQSQLVARLARALRDLPEAAGGANDA